MDELPISKLPRTFFYIISGLNTSRKYLEGVWTFSEASYLIVSSCIGLSCRMRISSIRRSMWWTLLLRVVTECFSSSSNPWCWWVCVDNSLTYSSWAACSWGRASAPPRVRLVALLWVCVSGCVSTTARQSVNAFVISIKWLVRCSWTCLLTTALNPYQKLKKKKKTFKCRLPHLIEWAPRCLFHISISRCGVPSSKHGILYAHTTQAKATVITRNDVAWNEVLFSAGASIQGQSKKKKQNRL